MEEVENTYTSDEREEPTARSLPEYMELAEERFRKLHFKVMAIVVLLYGIAMGWLLVDLYHNRGFNTLLLAVLGVIGVFVLMLARELSPFLEWIGIREKYYRETLPAAIAEAPRDLDGVLKSYLRYMNERRRSQGLRGAMRVELLADAQYQEFQGIIDQATAVNIIYTYPGHYSEFTSEYMNDGELYVQCQWNVERQYIEELMYSFIHYEGDTRTFYWLQLDPDMKTYRGIQSDTISMGFRTDEPDAP